MSVRYAGTENYINTNGNVYIYLMPRTKYNMYN